MRNLTITLLLGAIMTLSLNTLNAQGIIPEPQLLHTIEGPSFKLTQKSLLIASGREELKSANFFKKYLLQHYNIELSIVSEPPRVDHSHSTTIQFMVEQQSAKKRAVEGYYTLKVEQNSVKLKGADGAGLFYAMQSLIQLLPTKDEGESLQIESESLQIAQLEIEDWPRFEYRGMHLDVVRHIWPVEYIKRYLDYLALHKMNHFHWHLTDDQGWRIESKSHPKLNEIGSWRSATIIGLFPGTGVDSTRYGGYYKVEEIAEIIQYAEERYITIVPEIDVPGHSMAILAAYPQFSTTPHLPKEPAITWGIFNRENNVLAPSKELFTFLDEIFNEVIDLFPTTPYIHIGADECSKIWWQQSQETQQFMAQHQLANEESLQRYFAEEISKTVRARGRQFIGWDEMLDNGLVEGAIVMSWRNATNGLKAAELGHKTIMVPMLHSYLNIQQRENEDTLCHNSWLVTLESVYNFEPIPEGTPSKVAANIIGGQGAMWTEYFPHKERLEYALFPRMSAIAEVYWTLPERKSFAKFNEKIKQYQENRYTLWGANYYSE